MRKVMAVLFLVLGAISLLFAIYDGKMKWLALGAGVLFFTKSVLSFLLGRDSKYEQSKILPTSKEWQIIMIGYLLSAVLFFVSGLAGEGWVGFVAAPALLISSVAFRFVAKKAETFQEKAGG